MVGFAWAGVVHTSGVIPHFVQVREVAACHLHRLVQGAIGKTVRTVENGLGRLVPVGMPVITHHLHAAVDAAGGHDDVFSQRLKRYTAFFFDTMCAANAPILQQQLLYPVTKAQSELVGIGMALQCGDELLGQSLSCAPDKVKTRHRVAGAKLPALYPVHHREKANAVLAHPVVHVLRAAVHIRLCPGLGPVVVGSKLAKAEPIAQSQFSGVTHAHSALLGRVHKKHTAKALTRQAAKHGIFIAVQQDHRFAAVQQPQRRGDTGNAAAHNQHITTVGLHRLSLYWYCATILLT